jgi:two-component system NarL family sensor kinase
MVPQHCTVRNIFLVLLFGLSEIALAQPGADLLELNIRQTEGLIKAEAIYDAVAFYTRSDLDKAKTHVDEIVLYAGQHQDPLLDAYALLSSGVYHAATGQPDSAIFLIEKGEQIAAEKNYAPFLIRSGANLGRAYISTGNAEKALTYLYKTLDLTTANPHKEIELRVRATITWAYLELMRFQDCVSYGRKGIAMVPPEFEYIIPYFCNNMASSYGALDKIDSATYFVLKGLPIAVAKNDNSLAANSYFILGNIYTYTGQFDKAIEQFKKARPYREKVGTPLFIVSDLNAVSSLYHQKGDYVHAVENGLAALALAEKENLTLKFPDVYQSLAQGYEALKDFKNATHYYDLLSDAKDKVYQQATADALAEMQTKYETENKNQQINALNKDNALKTATIERNYLFIGGLVMTLALLLVLFYLLRYRSNQKQKAVAQEQKIRLRDAQITAVVDSQEQERKRFASDLHDGMGQLVSALQLNIQSIKKGNDLDKTVAQVENSEQLLSEIQGEIRNIAFNLMPPVLVKEGLVPAVAELIRRLNKTGSIKATLSAHDVQSRFSQIVEISIYRIIQELLSNISKHSKASELVVSFTGFEDELVLTVEDNGHGFDLKNFQNSEHGNGWRTLQTRVNLIHGQIEFDTVQGRKNNTVIVHIPVPKDKDVPAHELQNT